MHTKFAGLRRNLSSAHTQAMFFNVAGIRLAGATSDVHVLDVRTGRWDKLVPQGEPPSPRAAHAAAAVGSMVVVQVCLPDGIRFQVPSNGCTTMKLEAWKSQAGSLEPSTQA